jgi:hypothetical protein
LTIAGWLHRAAAAACLLVAFVAVARTDHAEGAVFASTAANPTAEAIDGVPLVPVTKTQRESCQTFANQLRRAVPCPGLLPDPIPVPSTYSGPPCLGTVGELACGPAVNLLDARTVFGLSQSNFQVPPGYVGVTFQQYSGHMVPESSISGGPLGHFVFMAGTDLQSVMTNMRGKNVVPVPPYCSPLDSGSPIRVHGRLATLYQCGSFNSLTENELVSGHTLLVWKDAGFTCEVSFHGHSQVNIDLDVAVAKATVLISPKR